MATANSDGHSHKVLLFWPESMTKNVRLLSTILLASFAQLIAYLWKNVSKTDTFDIHIPGEYLAKLLDDPVCSCVQVRRIYAYYPDVHCLQQDQDRFQYKYDKLQFCLERDLVKQLENAETGIAVHSSQSIDRGALNDITTLTIKRLYAKRAVTSDRDLPVFKRFASPSQHGFRVVDFDEVDPRFICSICKLVLSKPSQLACGHRQCKSCVNTQNFCVICSEFIVKDKVWLDRGLIKDMQTVSKSCSGCQWTGPLDLYREHIEQSHRDCSVCNEPTDRKDSHRHYLSETHQRHLSSICATLLGNNSNINNDQIDEIIRILSSRASVLDEDLQRMINQLTDFHNTLKAADEQIPLLKKSTQETSDRISVMQAIQNLSHQDILSIEECIENRRPVSVDGSYIWKITNVREKTMDARSERSKSIYSPPFYSSPTGYKMCLRLYLNGDGDTRDTHMSLFLVVMRGEYDAILRWPFDFRVSLSLLHILPSNNDNASKCFWSDITSTSFQRPIIDMNLASGIPKFYPLDAFEQNRHQFIENDTIHVKVILDFLSERPASLPPASISTSPNDEEHTSAIYTNFPLLVQFPNTI